MPRNIEIKALIDDLFAIERLVAGLADTGPVPIAQDDTFFTCPTGRLKLRVFASGEGELIFYRRANEQGPKESFYIRSPAPNPDSLREALGLAYGLAGRVIKRRTLYLVGRTRIHLDRVEGLGSFLELEVVLVDDEPTEAGVREAHDLLERLGIPRSSLLETAYVDLLT
ncbi:MAG: class IV adenylate cyclase [Rhodothermales bacterium]|nr:class IV adenylate cyclase [Rhodothermales bacterium]